MTIYVVNVFDVCDAVKQMLLADTALMDLKSNVVNGELINEDPGNCPWVGIYRTSVRFPSRAIGTPGGRNNNVGLVLITQEQSVEGGEDCARKLEVLNQHVLRVLLNDESLKGLVDVLDDIEIVYHEYGLVQNAYMQTSHVHFVGVQRVTSR